MNTEIWNEAYEAYMFNGNESLWDNLDEQIAKGMSLEDARCLANDVIETANL